MLTKITTFIEKHESLRQACLFCSTLRTVALMLVPAIIGGYLIWRYDDLIVIALAVVLILVSLFALVKSAYLSELQKLEVSKTNKDSKK